MSADTSLKFPQSTVTCEGCDAVVDVIWFCKNCPASLCTMCKKEHSKQRFLRNHEVVERSGSVLLSQGSRKIAPPCQKHEGKNISTYCIDCNVPCCLTCMEESHQRHSFTCIEKKYMDAEAELNDFVQKLKKETIQSMKSDISRLNELLESCTVDYEAAEKEVEKFRQKINDIIDQSCDTFIKEIMQKQTESYSKLQSCIEKVQKQMHSVKKAMEKVETRIRQGGLDLIEFSPDPSLFTSQTQSITSYLRPKFIPNTNVLSILAIFTVHLKYETVSGAVNEEKMVHVGIPCVDTTTIRSFMTDINGHTIEPVSNGTAWISERYSESLYLYDVSGKMVKFITVNGSNGINDIAVKKTGDLIVTCRDKKVRHVCMTGKSTVMIDTQSFVPKAVCLTEIEEIVVCMAGQDVNNHVAVYSSDGQSKIRDIVARDDKGKLMFSDLYCIVMNGESVTVLNYQRNVLNVNQGGKVIWVYNGSQTKLNTAFYPIGMCKDMNSNILISDFNNHCVHCLNSEGTFLQMIVRRHDGINYPWGIAVSTDMNKLLLGSSLQNVVWVVTYRTQ